MVDIHCHILSGLDDGAEDLQESVEMARLAYEDGIRHIIATPHFNVSYYNHRNLVRSKVKELQRTLDELNIPITVLPGNEVRLESASFIYEHAKRSHFCYLGRSEKYVLLEQKWSAYNEETPAIIKWFLDRGTTPIIPHPERHTFFRQTPQLLIDCLEAGAWTQVSADSLLGKNSEDAKLFAEWLLEHNYAHTVATDAHNVHRKSNLSEGFRLVQEITGSKTVQEIRTRMKAILL